MTWISSGLAIRHRLLGMRIPGRTSSSGVSMPPTGTLARNLGLLLFGLDLGVVVLCLLGRLVAKGACDGAKDVEVQPSLGEVRRFNRGVGIEKMVFSRTKGHPYGKNTTYTSTCTRARLLLLGHVLRLML